MSLPDSLVHVKVYYLQGGPELSQVLALPALETLTIHMLYKVDSKTPILLPPLKIFKLDGLGLNYRFALNPVIIHVTKVSTVQISRLALEVCDVIGGAAQ